MTLRGIKIGMLQIVVSYRITAKISIISENT